MKTKIQTPNKSNVKTAYYFNILIFKNSINILFFKIKMLNIKINNFKNIKRIMLFSKIIIVKTFQILLTITYIHRSLWQLW